MFLVLTWALLAFLLALWSFAAWAFHSIATWTISSADALAGGPVTLEGWSVPDWLALWIPPELTLLLSSLPSQFTPFVETALQQMPALAGGLSTLVWVAWGLGTALLIITGLAASAAIVMARSGKLSWKR